MEDNKMLIDNAPFFFVEDVVKSGEYYKDKLGFAFDRYWGEPATFCMPTRDGLTIMLQQKEAEKVQPNGIDGSWDAYFWVRDADGLYEEFKAKGVEIVYEPEIKAFYDMKEFARKDLNGYIIAFGQNWEGK